MITLLLSTYNGSKFLKDFFKFLENQTFNDWKLIIRDDNSQDDTLKIVKNFALKYPTKIQIIEDNLGNLGACKSFFKLLRYANSDYIMFCDQDDIWLPEKIEKTFKKMLELETKYGKNTPILVHTDLKVVDENLNMISESFWKYQGLNPEYKSLNYLLVQNNVTGCTMMINKSLKRLITKIPENAIMHDWWFALVASAFGVIDYIKEALILYRQHKYQDTGAKEYSLLYICKRIFKLNDAIEFFLKLYAQAQEFYEIYKDNFSEKNKKILLNFLLIPKTNNFNKIKIFYKYRFFKQGFARNIGMLRTLFFI